ncbi:glycerophosphoryl diester phosphodiesterase [Mesorhizobium sp. J18]|uniref:glycerophosphodiester phosphodiesterase family protein n=1 Tax=Mesorhizobium sp. J18 TaxID=935263 RepID=UPI00119BB425|nr:glycerophosphodiester phosphodiesterase family protein [Mesorhizobium sp. J18]TWG95408.1 glycerophosphoryl diester phosphodiesterase [Mesorhizobium sp. J18]
MRMIGALAALFFVSVASPTMAETTRIAEIIERLENANQWRDHIMVIAHRGGGLTQNRARFPENSIAAVENAIELGAEMVEIDVQKTKDGIYVVLHDTWLNRTTTCRGKLIERTLSDLASCRLVVEGTGQVTQETVPTLAGMLEHTKGRILVNIDNKLGMEDLVGIAAVARESGVESEVVIKQNLWNAEKVAEMRRVMARIGDGIRFMPIMADDAVKDVAFLEHATRPFGPDAVEMITWHRKGTGMTDDGGLLFGARARAVAARGDWHLWVNTIAIEGQPMGPMSGGRGDQMAVSAGMPEEIYGFWAEEGATMIQTDEPALAIEWLEQNGYRVPYGLTN